jgi:AraC-like DNA-binding protein
MKISNSILLFMFAFLAGHILFLVLTLLIKDSKSNTRLLGVLLLLLLIRVGKSVISLAIPERAFEISIIGIACMAAIGPVLLVYVKSLFQSSRAINMWLALSPSLLTLFIGSWTLLNLGYYFITAHYLLYLTLAANFLFTNRESLRADNIRWKWALVLVGSFGAVWLTFALQLFVYDRLLYLIIVIVSLVLSYGLSLWAVTQQKLFTSAKTKKEFDAEDHALIGLQIKQLFKDEIYIDASLNLTVLSKRLNKQPYLVSRVINDQFNKTFPELLVHYRIKKAEELLLSSMNKTYTVEGIAYESGFSTLSAFYTAFKKETGMTPTQFKKNNEGRNMRIA